MADSVHYAPAAAAERLGDPRSSHYREAGVSGGANRGGGAGGKWHTSFCFRSRHVASSLARGAQVMKEVALSEMKDDLSRYLRRAAKEAIVITRQGKAAGILIGF